MATKPPRTLVNAEYWCLRLQNAAIWSTLAKRLKHWTNLTDIEVVAMGVEDTQVLSADEIKELIEEDSKEEEEKDDDGEEE
jgi:precorrin isomerase